MKYCLQTFNRNNKEKEKEKEKATVVRSKGMKLPCNQKNRQEIEIIQQ